MDTRWSHTRKATQGLTTAIVSKTGLIVGRSHQVHYGGNRFMPNTDVPSNMMESVGVADILNDFNKKGILNLIKSMTRDRDNKSEAIFESFGIFEKQRHDPGHFRKNFRTMFSSFVKENEKYTGPEKLQNAASNGETKASSIHFMDLAPL